jgi:gluconate 5-dehydrogenase
MADETPRKSVDELRKLFDLSGKVAVVTGAGGTLGHALAKGLAVFGADVACWDIKTDIMEDVVADIKGLGKKATASAVDVTDDAKVKAAMEGVIKDFGKVNIMITVAIGSVRGFLGHPGGYAAYGTSKGAVHLLTKQLATEWAKHRINVNAIAPSIFWTPLTQQIKNDPEMVKIFMARIPLGRAAELDDFVGPAVFLASPASDYVTGLILSVDGGAVAG